MRWRWMVAILWAGVASWAFYLTVSNEFSTVGDYGFAAVLLVLAILIARGRALGAFVAFLGMIFAGFVTFIFVMMNLSPCSFICAPAWLIAPSAVLTIVSLLAFREMTRRAKAVDTGEPPA